MSTEASEPVHFPDEPLDLAAYAPYFLSSISNRWTSLSSQVYNEAFGIGIVEWRILGYLGSPQSGGSAAAQEVAADLGLDQALVSRAKQKLIKLGFVALRTENMKGSVPRQHLWHRFEVVI